MKIALCVWAWLLLLALEPARAFYDPGTQRWPNRDPIGEAGGINLYAFIGNDPRNRFDAAGLEIYVGAEMPCDSEMLAGCAATCLRRHGPSSRPMRRTMRRVTIVIIPATCFNTRGALSFNFRTGCDCMTGPTTPPINN